MFRARLRGRRRDEYAGRVLVQQSALALFAATGLALAAALCGGVRGELAWVVAAVVPLVLLREFCRRLGFAHDRIAGVLALDLAVAALQLGALAWLTYRGWLTASLAFAAVGLVCGGVALVCLVLGRGDLALRRRRVGREVGRHWTFGRWVAAGQLVGVVHGYTIHWLLVLMIGPAATGAFTACLTVLLLSNPFVLALGNLLGPWTARARAEGGGAVVELLYGPGYAGHEVTLTALAVAFAAAPAGISADHGLRALGRPRVAFTGSVIGLAVTTTGAALLIHTWASPAPRAATSWARAQVPRPGWSRSSSCPRAARRGGAHDGHGVTPNTRRARLAPAARLLLAADAGDVLHARPRRVTERQRP